MTEKNPLPHRGLKPASTLCLDFQSDTTTWAYPSLLEAENYDSYFFLLCGPERYNYLVNKHWPCQTDERVSFSSFCSKSFSTFCSKTKSFSTFCSKDSDISGSQWVLGWCLMPKYTPAHSLSNTAWTSEYIWVEILTFPFRVGSKAICNNTINSDLFYFIDFLKVLSTYDKLSPLDGI